MHVMRNGICAILLLVLIGQLFGQLVQDKTTPPQASTQEPAAGSPQNPAESGPGGEQAPAPRVHSQQQDSRCWKQAGIPAGKVNERWKIEDNGKVRINEVCSDPSLTPERKRDKIRQINEETEQQVAKIIPAKQLETLKACEAKLEQEKASRPGAMPQKQLGPCGGIIPAQPGTPAHSHGGQRSPSPNQ